MSGTYLGWHEHESIRFLVLRAEPGVDAFEWVTAPQRQVRRRSTETFPTAEAAKDDAIMAINDALDAEAEHWKSIALDTDECS